jgi:hypothetical protein
MCGAALALVFAVLPATAPANVAAVLQNRASKGVVQDSRNSINAMLFSD